MNVQSGGDKYSSLGEQTPEISLWGKILASLAFVGGGGLIFSGVSHLFLHHEHLFSYLSELALITGGILIMVIEAITCFPKDCIDCAAQLKHWMACLTKVSGQGLLFVFLGALNLGGYSHNMDLLFGAYLVIIGLLCIITGGCGTELCVAPEKPIPETGTGAYVPPSTSTELDINKEKLDQ